MSKEKETKPYGLWPSPYTAKMTGDLLEFSELTWQADECLLWRERSSDQASLMCWNPSNNKISNLSGEFNIGGGIMYGGGSFTNQGNKIAFVDKTTKQLHLVKGGYKNPAQLSQGLQNASTPLFSPDGNTLIFVNSNGIVDNVRMLNLDNPKTHKILISGADFYNYLRWQPDGSHLAWVSWDHPFMPWDSSQLFLGKLASGNSDYPRLDFVLTVAGGEGTSILQPEFSPDGQNLAYISDQDGWWQIYLIHLDSGESTQLTCAQADHGLPPWLQNQITYAFSPDSQKIYFIRNQLGFASLWQLDLNTGIETRINLDEEYTWLESLSVSPEEDRIALVASGGRKPAEIVIVSPTGDLEVIQYAQPKSLPKESYSKPEAVTFSLEYEETVHGLFYKPQNPLFEGDGKPPMIMIIHSGPTRQKYAEFQPRTQYFTSRGYAVLEINYPGSTGYGREYWEQLNNNWGIVDTLYINEVSKQMVNYDLVDLDKIVLLGSSSGGFTLLNLLIAHPGVFKAGIILYGVSDLATLFSNPTKFERFYDYWLLGIYSSDNQIRTRSPIFVADKIRDPIAIFQGGKDPIVLPEHAELLVKALKENKVPYEYFLYPDEGHGFKKSENVQDFYEKTEQFLEKYVLE